MTTVATATTATTINGKKILLLQDRLLVELAHEEEKKSPAGIVLTGGQKEKPVQGKVLAVGAGKRTKSGEVHALPFTIGDTVLFGKYAGTEVKIGTPEKEFIVLREEDVIAIIED